MTYTTDASACAELLLLPASRPPTPGLACTPAQARQCLVQPLALHSEPGYINASETTGVGITVPFSTATHCNACVNTCARALDKEDLHDHGRIPPGHLPSCVCSNLPKAQQKPIHQALRTIQPGDQCNMGSQTYTTCHVCVEAKFRSTVSRFWSLDQISLDQMSDLNHEHARIPIAVPSALTVRLPTVP